jgi:hypothetical protein
MILEWQLADKRLLSPLAKVGSQLGLVPKLKPELKGGEAWVEALSWRGVKGVKGGEGYFSW